MENNQLLQAAALPERGNTAIDRKLKNAAKNAARNCGEDCREWQLQESGGPAKTVRAHFVIERSLTCAEELGDFAPCPCARLQRLAQHLAFNARDQLGKGDSVPADGAPENSCRFADWIRQVRLQFI